MAGAFVRAQNSNMTAAKIQIMNRKYNNITSTKRMQRPTFRMEHILENELVSIEQKQTTTSACRSANTRNIMQTVAHALRTKRAIILNSELLFLKADRNNYYITQYPLRLVCRKEVYSLFQAPVAHRTSYLACPHMHKSFSMRMSKFKKIRSRKVHKTLHHWQKWITQKSAQHHRRSQSISLTNRL